MTEYIYNHPLKNKLIRFGANNYLGLQNHEGKIGKIIAVARVRDNIGKSLRPCIPLSYTTKYYVECETCKKNHKKRHGGVLFDRQFKVL